MHGRNKSGAARPAWRRSGRACGAIAALALAALLAGGCDRRVLRQEVNQGAHELFQTAVDGVVQHLSGQIQTAAQWEGGP